ncbi:unnamed protein product [Lampetra planeri]
MELPYSCTPGTLNSQATALQQQQHDLNSGSPMRSAHNWRFTKSVKEAMRQGPVTARDETSRRLTIGNQTRGPRSTGDRQGGGGGLGGGVGGGGWVGEPWRRRQVRDTSASADSSAHLSSHLSSHLSPARPVPGTVAETLVDKNERGRLSTFPPPTPPASYKTSPPSSPSALQPVGASAVSGTTSQEEVS